MFDNHLLQKQTSANIEYESTQISPICPKNDKKFKKLHKTQQYQNRTESKLRNIFENYKQISSNIIQSFNSWSFKREQPDNIMLINKLISEKVNNEEPIQFIFYWGRGPRSSIASADVQCLDFVYSMANRIKSIYVSGASIKVIFTDTHAELNGYDRITTLNYFGEVATAARERGFEICMLGDLVEAARGRIELDEFEDAMAPDILANLCACASKWYGGEGSTEEGATRYYQANMVEKRAVEIAFPTSIFITFNGGKFRSLFPASLPIFYMYSLRRGVGVKPWFVNSEPRDHDNQGLPSLISA